MEKHDEYFEGILQLRNPDREIIDFVKKNVFNEISKEKKIGDGFDYYFRSNKSLLKIGKKLKEHFSGELKISRKIFTRDRQTSKDVYRINVLFRCCKYKKGEIIRHRGEELQILGLGRNIFAKNIKTGGKVHLKYGDV